VHVIATARRAEVLKEMEDMGMTTIALDVTDADSIAACKEKVSDLTGGKLDYLVNNAYIAPSLTSLQLKTICASTES
jgi:1-acylglycerone phosphate reductase